MEALREFEEQCPVCFAQFSEESKAMMVCSSQHVCCKTCLHLTAGNSFVLKCPECRQSITIGEVERFEYFQKVIRLRLDLKRQKINKIQVKQYEDEEENQSSELLRYLNNEQYKQKRSVLEVHVNKGRQCVSPAVDALQAYGVRLNQKALLSRQVDLQIADIVQHVRLDIHEVRLPHLSNIMGTQDNPFIGVSAINQSSRYQFYGPSVFDYLAVAYMYEPNYPSKRNCTCKQQKSKRINIELSLAWQQLNTTRETMPNLKVFQQVRYWDILGMICLKKGVPQVAINHAQSVLLLNKTRIIARFLMIKFNLNMPPLRKIESLKVIIEECPDYGDAL